MLETLELFMQYQC